MQDSHSSFSIFVSIGPLLFLSLRSSEHGARHRPTAPTWSLLIVFVSFSINFSRYIINLLALSLCDLFLCSSVLIGSSVSVLDVSIWHLRLTRRYLTVNCTTTCLYNKTGKVPRFLISPATVFCFFSWVHCAPIPHGGRIVWTTKLP